MSKKNVKIFSSAAYGLGANNSDVQFSPDHKGVRLYLVVSAVSGTTPTLDVKIQVFDDLTGSYIDLPGASFAQKTGVSSDELVIFSGITATANRSVNTILPMSWRAVATVGGTATPTVTFTLSASLLD